MVSSPPWLHTIDDSTLPAKAQRLAALAQAGLPVPRGLIVDPHPGVLDDPGIDPAIQSMLEHGPVVVRSALWGEDQHEGSAAGLGRSRLNCRDREDVREALADLAQQRDDPWLVAYRRGASGRDTAIVQMQIDRHALLVAALVASGPTEVEVHTAGGEVLAEGRTPQFAGRLADWADPAQAAVHTVIERTRGHLEPAEHGHDLELVVDPHGEVHLVQARPLAAPLHPGWAPFERAMKASGAPSSLPGVLTLDAEHNPTPLSPAHAELMQWLGQRRPRAGQPIVLAGWLYVRTLPRNLARDSAPGSSDPPTAVQTVKHLHEVELPRARAALHAVHQSLATATVSDIERALPRAQRAFLAMIDTYIERLVPARTRARATQSERVITSPTPLLSISGRDPFLDVLPAVWDLASPSLAELGTVATGARAHLPADEATAAIVLGEWDDHLFALGLAPLRAWILAATKGLGIPPEDAFMRTIPELSGLLRGEGTLDDHPIAARRDAHQRNGALRPPLRLHDGRPVSFGRRARLRGLPIGPSFTGPLAPRADLNALLTDPPAPGSIVTLPSLTAPAAVALRQLGIEAVCCEYGGPLSHAALMVRELELSALVGCRGCTELDAGRRARIDTTAGRLVLEPLR